MAIYDLLRSNPAAGELEFTTNAAVLSVPVSFVNPVPFISPIAFDDFADGDNAILQAIWFSIPHGMIPAMDPTQRFNLNWGITPVNELSDGEGFWIPAGCGVEFRSQEIFLRHPGGAAFPLQLSAFVMSISMVNLPTDLDAQTFTMSVHLLVKHTLPLV